MKLKFIFIFSTLLILSSCGPNAGYCSCGNQDANRYYQWGATQLFQRNRVEKMCQSRATTYNTTCTLTVSGSK